MRVVECVSDIRRQIARWRSMGQRIAFVPTMGNLHAGHISLVEQAQTIADKTVVSIFVNPAQFGAGEDFDSYPRTKADDRKKLALTQTDLLFMPDVYTLYADNPVCHVRVDERLAGVLCGASRPGHFDGVATVVSILFNQVQPDVAVFGEKDYQQLLIIRQLVRDLAFPVEIVSGATYREPDGLAMSSRNRYLSVAERAVAARLYEEIQQGVKKVRQAIESTDKIIKDIMRNLGESGFLVDYVEIRRDNDLALPQAGDRHLRLFAAARLGKARLIDNAELTPR